MPSCFFFFFNDTATTEIYTLSLHDALPIYTEPAEPGVPEPPGGTSLGRYVQAIKSADRKSTRLNSSHSQISYAVFCLKKKKTILTLLLTISQLFHTQPLRQLSRRLHSNLSV